MKSERDMTRFRNGNGAARSCASCFQVLCTYASFAKGPVFTLIAQCNETLGWETYATTGFVRSHTFQVCCALVSVYENFATFLCVVFEAVGYAGKTCEPSAERSNGSGASLRNQSWHPRCIMQRSLHPAIAKETLT